MAARRLSRRHKPILQWIATDYQRTRGMLTSSHQDLGRALPGAKGNISHQSADPRGPGPDCHWVVAWRESRIRMAHRGGSAMGLTACRKL